MELHFFYFLPFLITTLLFAFLPRLEPGRGTAPVVMAYLLDALMMAFLVIFFLDSFSELFREAFDIEKNASSMYMAAAIATSAFRRTHFKQYSSPGHSSREAGRGEERR